VQTGEDCKLNAEVNNSESQSQTWYFEKWHEYQKKKDAIQGLYLDVLKWGAQKTGLSLLNGKSHVALDVGSAHGYVVGLLSKLGYEAHGCELSKLYISRYAKRNIGNFLACDAQRLPFTENKMDLITAFELVEHLPRFSDFLGQCFDALKEGGTLVITTPQASLKPLNLKFWRDYALGSLILNNRNIDGHSHEFASSAELKFELEKIGFRTIFAETWWFAPVSPTTFNRYFVGRLPLFVIPHLRCIAIK
jgi:2-polyprenyl-3-methyl-5-hydroxy-6-metoxy-1,4-benzoquinol methylase